MKYLFSQKNLQSLESFCRAKTLFAFDFDGTLAKIVPTPSEARMHPEVSRLLSLLNESVPLAIISGRSIQDLTSRVDFMPRYLIGNHGMEGIDAQTQSLETGRQCCALWRERLSELLKSELLANEVEIEDKTFSLAIHYRKSRSRQQTRLMILRAVDLISPAPRIIPGKLVVNLVPSEAPHKGSALMETIRKAGADSAFFIGDDDTDEDVFSLPNAPVMTVRVAMKRTSQAQYFIRRQEDITRLLQLLLRFSGYPRKSEHVSNCLELPNTIFAENG